MGLIFRVHYISHTSFLLCVRSLVVSQNFLAKKKVYLSFNYLNSRPLVNSPKFLLSQLLASAQTSFTQQSRLFSFNISLKKKFQLWNFFFDKLFLQVLMPYYDIRTCMAAILGQYSDYTLIILWLYYGNTLIILWLYSDYTLIIFWLYYDYILAILWLYSGHTILIIHYPYSDYSNLWLIH